MRLFVAARKVLTDGYDCPPERLSWNDDASRLWCTLPPKQRGPLPSDPTWDALAFADDLAGELFGRKTDGFDAFDFFDPEVIAWSRWVGSIASYFWRMHQPRETMPMPRFPIDASKLGTEKDAVAAARVNLTRLLLLVGVLDGREPAEPRDTDLLTDLVAASATVALTKRDSGGYFKACTYVIDYELRATFGIRTPRPWHNWITSTSAYKLPKEVVTFGDLVQCVADCWHSLYPGGNEQR